MEPIIKRRKDTKILEFILLNNKPYKLKRLQILQFVLYDV